MVQLKNTKDGQEIMANFCPVHVLESQKAIRAMDVLREMDKPLARIKNG